MFKINLYPEHDSKQHNARVRVARKGILVGLLGLELLVVGSLYLSASLLSDRADQLKDMLPGLQSRISAYKQPGPELEIARQMLQLRDQRIDWAPKLAAMSEIIPLSLQLERLNGHIELKREPAKLELEGKVVRGKDHLEQVTEFIASLQDDDRISAKFPGVHLETLKGDQSGQFQVVCGPGRNGS